MLHGASTNNRKIVTIVCVIVLISLILSFQQFWGEWQMSSFNCNIVELEVADYVPCWIIYIKYPTAMFLADIPHIVSYNFFWNNTFTYYKGRVVVLFLWFQSK